jgi:metal-responsive CopG/Arc/MetJ family transcriptional regulator
MLRVNAIFEEGFLKMMTQVAREEHLSRSELIRKAVADYLARHEQNRLNRKRQKSVAEAIVVQDALRQKAGDWDGVAEVRRWRNLPAGRQGLR